MLLFPPTNLSQINNLSQVRTRPPGAVAAVIKQWIEKGELGKARDLALCHLQAVYACEDRFYGLVPARHLLHWVDAAEKKPLASPMLVEIPTGFPLRTP